MHARRNGVDANLGARTMATSSLQSDAKTVDAREGRVAIEHKP